MNHNTDLAHISVMPNEVVEQLGFAPAGVFVDGTTGCRAGHARAILSRLPQARQVICMDRDPKAIKSCQSVLAEFTGRYTAVNRGYEELAFVIAELGITDVSGVNLDLGVSSDQLSSERGFSFRKGQPLDMRFNPEGGDPTAAEVIANIDQKELAKQLWELAEVPAADRLAKRMKEASRQGLMETTDDLVAVCNEVLGPRIRKISSATLPFQALRIMTNRELERLDSFLESAPGLLAKGGRIAILSFHSVEDRMVKFAFRRLAETGDFKMPFRKAMKPSREEILSNRRSRSAKLRVLERCN